MKRDNVYDWIILFVVCLISVSFGYAVLDAAAGYQQYTPRTSEYDTPDIPKCDAELWDRIKDRCADD